MTTKILKAASTVTLYYCPKSVLRLRHPELFFWCVLCSLSPKQVIWIKWPLMPTRDHCIKQWISMIEISNIWVENFNKRCWKKRIIALISITQWQTIRQTCNPIGIERLVEFLIKCPWGTHTHTQVKSQKSTPKQ